MPSPQWTTAGEEGFRIQADRGDKLGEIAGGTLYGKTGSGLRGGLDGPKSDVDFDMGWLVGFVMNSGKRYAYACLVLGDGLTGKDARRVVESALGSGAWP